MTTESVFRKDGVPALAWASNNTSSSSSSSSTSSCSCSLVIKVNHACAQAAIVLCFNLPIHGFDTAQRISLVYNADNWVAGEMERGQEVVTPWHIKQLARAHRGGDKMDSLTVVLKQPCTILCPGKNSIAPGDKSDSRFHQVVALAKATRIAIVFDGAWLRPQKSTLLSTLLQDTNLVNRFPLREGEVELDWTVFHPCESAPPPAYGDGSLKRLERCKSMHPSIAVLC